MTILTTTAMALYLAVPKCRLVYVASTARIQAYSSHISAATRKACRTGSACQYAIASGRPLTYIETDSKDKMYKVCACVPKRLPFEIKRYRVSKKTDGFHFKIRRIATVT